MNAHLKGFRGLLSKHKVPTVLSAMGKYKPEEQLQFLANAAADTVLCLRSIVSTLSILFGVEHLGKPLDHLGFGRGIGIKGELLGARHVSEPTIGYMQC